MIQQVFLSIIIPVYNVEKYLSKCLDSVLNLSFTDWEAVVINDCSPDNSLSIIKEYQKKDSRIKLINNEINLGLGFTRNKGLEAAEGKYILFLDSDDWINDNLSELMVLAKKQNVDVIETPYKVHDKGASYILPKQHQSLLNCVVPGVRFLNLVPVLSVVVWNKIYNKQFLDRTGVKFPNRKFEDICFSLEVIFLANKVIRVDTQFYNYIIRPDSIMTSNSNLNTLKDLMKLMDDLEKLYIQTLNVEIQKNFFYSFTSIANVLLELPNSGFKNTAKAKYKRKYNKYRLEILRSKKIGALQRILLFISPKSTFKLLKLVKRFRA